MLFGPRCGFLGRPGSEGPGKDDVTYFSVWSSFISVVSSVRSTLLELIINYWLLSPQSLKGIVFDIGPHPVSHRK